MKSPEGSGLARSAWDAWSRGSARVGRTRPFASVIRKISASMASDLFGFWLVWHLEGGFEGLERAGMNRATIYRKVKRFRDVMGVHPDDYVIPGVTIDLDAYLPSRESETT